MPTIIILISLFAACVIVGTVTILKAIRTYKHNEVLFSMRSVKSEMILDLTKRYTEDNALSIEETKAVLSYIGSLDGFCIDYNSAKSFFRSVIGFVYVVTMSKGLPGSEINTGVGSYRVSTISIENPSEDLKRFGRKYDKVIYDAFLTLIPFLKFRLFIMIFGWLGYLLALIGIANIRKFISKFLVVEDNYNNCNNGGPAHA